MRRAVVGFRGLPVLSRLLLVAGALALLALLAFRFVFRLYHIPSGAMLPTLQVGDRILANPLPYRFGKPRRGDVVVFHAPQAASPDEKEWVKRVIGIPGDRVSVLPMRVLADGQVVAAFVGTTMGGYFAAQDFGGGVSAPSAIETGQNTDPPTLQQGEVIVHRSGGERFRVVPVQDLKVRIDGSTVYNGDDYIEAFPGEFDLRADRNLAAYGGRPGVRGSVVLVNSEPRLILVRAKHLSIDPAHVELNGKPLVEPYIAEPPDYMLSELTVPEGNYWVMGDNRNDSNDSHLWGFLNSKRILARVDLVLGQDGHVGGARGR